MSLLTLFQKKTFTYTEKEREERRVPLSYPTAPRGWARWRPRAGHSPQYMGWVGMQRDAGTGLWHGPRSRCRSQRRVDQSLHAAHPFIQASVTCCPLLPSPALQRAFMRNWLRFSHCLVLWPPQGCSGLVPSSIRPGACLSSSGTVSLSA